MSDPRMSSPAAARNTAPIIRSLEMLLPEQGRVLEVGSGPGQHITAFAQRFPQLQWTPSDVNPAAIDSINARRADEPNLPIDAALLLDLSEPNWFGSAPDALAAMLSSNVCHISPWAVSVGLLVGAGALLEIGAPLLIYGPFKVDGEHTAPSNAEFDAWLRNSDASWGIRDIGALNAVAQANGLSDATAHAMPSNNFILEFRRI